MEEQALFYTFDLKLVAKMKDEITDAISIYVGMRPISYSKRSLV